MANFDCPAIFFGAFAEDKLIGANSIHGCSDGTWRSRGLWVDPEYRVSGIGRELLRQSLTTATEMGALFVWSMPRKTAWNTYKACGFKLTSEWVETETSGANAYAVNYLGKNGGTPKVWLLDSVHGHATQITKLLQTRGVDNIELITVGPQITTGDLVEIIGKLAGVVDQTDIVLCPWAITGDHYIDELFSNLAQKCTVVAAAGNTGQSIDDYTPARVQAVITVGSINKSLKVASHSNYSHWKKLEYDYGTNIYIDGVPYNGTSFAAANYVAGVVTNRITNTL